MKKQLSSVIHHGNALHPLAIFFSNSVQTTSAGNFMRQELG